MLTNFTAQCKDCRKRLSVHKTRAKKPKLQLPRHDCVYVFKTRGIIDDATIKEKTNA